MPDNLKITFHLRIKVFMKVYVYLWSTLRQWHLDFVIFLLFILSNKTFVHLLKARIVISSRIVKTIIQLIMFILMNNLHPRINILFRI